MATRVFLIAPFQMVFLILISNLSSYSASENFPQTLHFQVSTVMAKLIAHHVFLVYLLTSLLSRTFPPVGSAEPWPDRSSLCSVLQTSREGERELLFHLATVFPTRGLLLPDHQHPLSFILHTQLRHPCLQDTPAPLSCLLQNTRIPPFYISLLCLSNPSASPTLEKSGTRRVCYCSLPAEEAPRTQALDEEGRYGKEGLRARISPVQLI